MLKKINILTISLIFSVSVWGESKEKYNFFHPTPESQIRGIITDRPTKTDSPYTVDAGHFQFETDVLGYSHDKKVEGGISETINVKTFNNISIKAGITNNSDIEVLVTSFIEETQKTQGTKTTRRGVGDINLRYKYNLIGNDEKSAVSLAIIPYVKLPTASAGLSNHYGEGGLSVPLSAPLTGGIGFFTMFKIDHVKSSQKSGFETNYTLTWGLNKELLPKMNGAVEFYTRNSDLSGSLAENSLDFVITYLLTPKIQIDTGIYLGLNNKTQDQNSFLGLSMLF